MMNSRHAMKLVPRLEPMEERVVLSTAAIMAHRAPPAHLAHTPPNPVVFNLNPQSTGVQITTAVIDMRTHVIKIQGTVTYPASQPLVGLAPFLQPQFVITPVLFTTSISASVNQAVDNIHSVTGYTTSSPVKYDNKGFSTNFTLYLTASSGRFTKGLATLTISTYLPNYYYYYPPLTAVAPSEYVIVNLRAVHACITHDPACRNQPRMSFKVTSLKASAIAS